MFVGIFVRVDLLFIDAPEWPVPPPSAYSMMAAQCAGSYSMGTVAAIDHMSTECGRHSDHHHQHHHQNIQTVLIGPCGDYGGGTFGAAGAGGDGVGAGGDGVGSGGGGVHPLARHCFSVGASPISIVEREPSLLTSTTSLRPLYQQQQRQRAVSFPYGMGPDYGKTYFGTGPQHVTVATIADEPPVSKTASKAVLRPYNMQTIKGTKAEAVSSKQEQQQVQPNRPFLNAQILTISDLEMHASGSCDF